MEKIHIACPSCKTQLSFFPVEQWKEKTVTCPRCGYKDKAYNFKQVIISNPTKTQNEPQKHDDTLIVTNAKQTTSALGCLVVESSGVRLPLKAGHNVIGRKATTSTATIQIDGDRYMSRQHISIDAITIAGRYRHQLEVLPATNSTKLNGEPLSQGDIVILKPGDHIQLGRTTLLFSIANQI